MGLFTFVFAFVLGVIAAYAVPIFLMPKPHPKPASKPKPPPPMPLVHSEDEGRATVWLHESKPKSVSDSMEGEKAVLLLSDCAVTILPPSAEGAGKATPAIKRHSFPLEGVKVELARVHRTPWHRKNTIRLSHPTHLPHKWPQCYVAFETAKELERWFVMLSSAAQPNSSSLRECERQRVLRDFAGLPPRGGCAEALTALLHRVWYALHREGEILCAMRDEINEKLALVVEDIAPKLPQGVTVQLSLSSFEPGPAMPVIRSASLTSFSPLGEMDVDADIEYAGGLEACLEIRLGIPIPMTTRLVDVPVSIRATVKGGSGRARLSAHPPPSRCLWIGFHDVPDFEIDVDTQFGSTDGKHAQLSLAALPERIIETLLARIRVELADVFVLPHMEVIELPGQEKFDERKAKEAKKTTDAVAEAVAAALAASGPAVAQATASSKLGHKQSSSRLSETNVVSAELSALLSSAADGEAPVRKRRRDRVLTAAALVATKVASRLASRAEAGQAKAKAASESSSEENDECEAAKEEKEGEPSSRSLGRF